VFDSIKIKIQEAAISLVFALRSLPPLMRIIVVFCAVGIVPGYFAVRYVSRTFWDYRYRGAEITARSSFQNPKAPTVGSAVVLPLGNSAYSAYAEVTNENFELSADNIGYKFSFKTSTGETAYTTTGKLFLIPGGKYIVAAPRFIAIQPISSGSLALDQIHWQKRPSVPKVALTPIRPDAGNPISSDPFTVEAAVRNDSPYQLKKVELVIIVYDRDKKIQAVSVRQEFTVNPNEVRKFPITLPGLSLSKIATIDLVPQTDVLDPSNLLLMERNSTGSDLGRPTNNNF